MTKDEQGLPTLPLAEELTPLSQILITPELANAFSVTIEVSSTPEDVLRASQASISLQRQRASLGAFASFLSCKHRPLKGSHSPNGPINRTAAIANADGVARAEHSEEGEGGAQVHAATLAFPAIMSRDAKRGDTSHEGGVSACDTSNDGGDAAEKTKRLQPDTEDLEEANCDEVQEISREDSAARASKRPRLVWTSQLHKRFVEAVAHLGVKNAVPKTIIQLMNVEGLTRENVASHLQKYRFYLMRMQGASSEEPSPSDSLFASTPIPPTIASATHFLPFSPKGKMTIGALLPAPGNYGGFEHHPYGLIARAASQGMATAEQKQQMAKNQGQASTLSQHLLKLYPAGSH